MMLEKNTIYNYIMSLNTHTSREDFRLLPKSIVIQLTPEGREVII